MSGVPNVTPPADRRPGARGVRGWSAYVAASLASLAVVDGSQDPGWTDPLLKAAAAGLLVGAVLLWTARRRLLLAVALVLISFGLVSGLVAHTAREDRREEERWGGSTVSFNDARPVDRPTQLELAYVALGATREQVRNILGRPVGHGIQHVNDGPDLRCLAYAGESFRPSTGAGQVHAFCFDRSGHLVARREW